ncbi:MAG: hypothetical protein JOZ55_09585 [Alphaproteobacteria bacterium]|nr:hypothetical protein [Alphaproteobacteria bacterium]
MAGPARGMLLAAGLVSFLGLCACEAPATYAPRQGNSTGYSDERLAQNRWRVTFNGNAVTKREIVENYLLLRAAEVTLQSGYRWFVFDTRDTQAHTAYHTEFDDWPDWGFHRHFGWYWHDWDYADTYSTTHYDAYAEIVLLTPEQARREPRAVDANDVVARLSPPRPPPPAASTQ